MEWINCWYETKLALVISVVLEEVHSGTTPSCTSYEVVSLLICNDHGKDENPEMR